MDANEIEKVHQFLRRSPEEGVRRMLIDPKLFTKAHARLALKIARATDTLEFAHHFEQNDFPQIRMTIAESKIRDSFWQNLKSVLANRRPDLNFDEEIPAL